MVSVGATMWNQREERETRWVSSEESGSNFSARDDSDILRLAAPGADISPVLPLEGDPETGPFAYIPSTSANGTSFAAPFVAGLDALLKSIDPELSSSDRIRLLEESADSIGVTVAGGAHVWKRVNAYNAVVRAGVVREVDMSRDAGMAVPHGDGGNPPDEGGENNQPPVAQIKCVRSSSDQLYDCSMDNSGKPVFNVIYNQNNTGCFDLSDSYDPDGDPLSHYYFFLDENGETAGFSMTGDGPLQCFFVFQSAGRYPGRVSVCDDKDACDTIDTINVISYP